MRVTKVGTSYEHSATHNNNSFLSSSLSEQAAVVVENRVTSDRDLSRSALKSSLAVNHVSSSEISSAGRSGESWYIR